LPLARTIRCREWEGTQARAMAYAEYSRAPKPVAHQSIEARLSLLVDRRSRLIEEELVGLLHERARKSDALLFTRGKLQCPMAGLAEAPR
jgi:hypothetical protein